MQVKRTSVRLSRFVHEREFRRLVAVIADMADPADPPRRDPEVWVRRWLVIEANRPSDASS